MGPCWIWKSRYRNGYGRIKVAETRKYALTHRISYGIFIGPPSAEIDHLCRVLDCYNPSHLEDVSHVENGRRGDLGRHNAIKTHCPKGHEYNSENTYSPPAGGRYCRACGRAATKAYYRTKVTNSGRPTAPDRVP